MTIPFILHLHRRIFQYSGGRGGYLKSDPNIITSRASGVSEILFEPPSPEDTPFLLSELVDHYNGAQEERAAHPLILLGGFIVDFLAIHPVADGNGRLARLITTHELLAKGYGVARYVSVEQRISETKTAYYSSLRESQQRWHEDEHTVWPFISYLLSVLASSYDTFEERAAATGNPTGSKQDQIREYILQFSAPDFSRKEVEKAFPGISTATIRLVLNILRDEGRIKSDGSGRSARWIVTGPG
ncbi:MAG: Fic family protein [Solirubrobacterales bacterium]|nr:Fic family protein [Solirubrobacterales bacterium]